MRRLLAALVGTSLGLPAFAADLLQCVNPDVRDGLLWTVPNDGRPVIDSEMPDAIAALPKPDSIDFIGSAQRPSATSGTFRADGDSEPVLAAALAELAGSGWAAAESSSPPPSAFATAMTERSQTVCREGNALSLNARTVGANTYLSYNLPASSERSVCQRLTSMAPGRALDPNMPTLDVSALSPLRPASMRDGGNSGRTRRGSMNVLLEGVPLVQLVEHLSDQLDAQGWQLDAIWSGTSLAGSTWTRETSDGKQLVGSLDVIAQAASPFEVTFTLSELYEGDDR